MNDEASITRHLEQLLRDARHDEMFSTAVFDVGSRHVSVARGAVGTISWDGPPVQLDTPFDIASVTKPIVALLAMVLRDAGSLTLDDTIAQHLPDYAGTDKADITVQQLLAHTAGIPGQQPLYLTSTTAIDLLDAIRNLPLAYPPGSGVAYTSQGFIILGQILEAATGKSLDDHLQRLVLTPLGMSSTTFGLPIGRRHRAAATEWCRWRERLIQGTVHDENADVLGGCAAHAGLFSTVDDLALLCRAMLQNSRTASNQLLSTSSVQLMTTPHTPPGTEARALGWQGWDANTSPVGCRVSPASYGHTGFTGTSVWIDPSTDLYVVLLSNAVHPRRAQGRIQELRARFHDLSVELVVPGNRSRTEARSNAEGGLGPTERANQASAESSP